jgi:photosystem II stability/assembly factor-like uncharacterized protein
VRTPAWLALALVLDAPAAPAAPQWQALPGAPVAQRLDDLHFLDADHGWVCTGDGGIYRTSDGGVTWLLAYENPARYFRCIRFADAQHGFAGTLTSGAVLMRTTDGGGTWSTVTDLPEPRPNALCGLSVASSSVVYGVGSYAGPARLIKSVDGGATWTSKDLAPLASTAIDVYFKSPSEGFVVGSVGAFPTSNRSVVLHTTDGGATWQQRFVGTRLGEWCWKISFPTPAVGYVSLERFAGPMFLLKTVDGGLTWTELPFPDYNEQGVGFATPDVGWIGGADNPTMGTTDGGSTWTPTPWGDYLNRFQFLSPTLGYGSGVTVYRYAESSLAVGDDKPRPRPAQVAPNPFGPRTTIRFTLRRPGRVQLLIADPSGRVVRTLGEGPRDAGPHVVEWDGRTDRGARAPAGIYLYILHAGEQHEMGKLVRVP